MIVYGGQQLADWTEEGDPWIWTPGSIAQLRDQVHTEITAIARFVSNMRQEPLGLTLVPESKMAEFKDFYQEWDKYRLSIGFFATLTGSTVDRLKTFQRRARDWDGYWKGQAQRFGSVSAPPMSPKVPEKNNLDSYIKSAITYGAIVGGALLAWKVAQETGVLKDIFKSKG